MLVSQQNKVLLLDRKHEALIRPAIPHAINYNGHIVVPHRIDETIILRNLGFDPPSPVELHYDWPGRYTPFAHQKVTTSFLTVNPRAFVLNAIGTGKTLSAYWAADFLMRAGKLRRVVVVSPLSTLERVHGDALFGNFQKRNFTILYGTGPVRRKLFRHNFDFYIINYDGLPSICGSKRDGKKFTPVLLRDDIDLIIVDEFAAYRNGNTKRWKLLKKLIQPHMWVWGMSGTPTPNEPTDAYSEIKLINPNQLEPQFPSFRSFQLQTMSQVNQYKWAPRKEALEIVHSAMQPSIRFTREECVDLPECLYESRKVELTAEQAKAYKQMENDLVTEVKGGKITAFNEAVAVMRLVQIASGVVYDVHGKYRHLDCAPRLTVLEEVIEEAGSKVIVFVAFIGSLQMLEKYLSKRWSVKTVSGQTSKNERGEIFKNFQGAKDPHVIVAHPGCMSHGLTLTAAATVVWWSPTNKNEEYTQANGRIDRIGQTRQTLVMNLYATTRERKMYRRLEHREKMQGILLDMVAAQRDN